MIKINKDKINAYRIGCHYSNDEDFAKVIGMSRTGFEKMLDRGTAKEETVDKILHTLNLGKIKNGYLTKPIKKFTRDNII